MWGREEEWRLVVSEGVCVREGGGVEVVVNEGVCV